MAEITIFIAFIAGIISFLNPCVLPLIPGFIAYLSSSKNPTRMQTFLTSVFFVVGFTIVFAILGVVLSLIGQYVYSVQAWLGRIGGGIIIIFALNLLGVIKIPYLSKTHNIKAKKIFNKNYLNASVFGMAFAVGWTPCVGAVLGAVITLAVTKPIISFYLLLVYSLGLGIPFLLLGLFSTQATVLIQRSAKFLKYFNIVVGIFLLILGILVFTNNLNLIANFGLLNKFLLK